MAITDALCNINIDAFHKNANSRRTNKMQNIIIWGRWETRGDLLIAAKVRGIYDAMMLLTTLLYISTKQLNQLNL